MEFSKFRTPPNHILHLPNLVMGIQVFFTGDYELLCVMYGLSGASGKYKPGIVEYFLWIIKSFCEGRHCCLWCIIRSADLKVPLCVRGHSPLRSLQTLMEDHKKFVDAGADLKKAKEFNNVIGKAFFPIPLEKVYNA